MAQEPMTIVHKGNDYKHVYTIDTGIDKGEALHAFLRALHTELLKEKRQPRRLLFLKHAWDMLKGHNPEVFNIIANRIKPGRELSLYDFLYTPLYNRTHYIEREDSDENDHRMKIFVGNFVFRVEPNTDSLVDLFLNIKNLKDISANGGFPYGYSVLGYDTLNSVRIVFNANFLYTIDPESDPFKFILNKIKEGTKMEFLEFVTTVNMRTNTRVNTNTSAKLRL